jgi:hypothetical protein
LEIEVKRLLISTLICCQSAFAAIGAAPQFVGNGADDSVIVSFCTFDTTYYPAIADADSVIALRFGPGNNLVDSLTQGTTNMFNPRSGWYEIHYRGADGSGSKGIYRVYVRAKMGGAWRGAATFSYQVIDDQLDAFFGKLSADGDSIKDTLAAILHAGDPVAVDSGQLARAVWDDDVIARSSRRIGWTDSTDVVNSVPSSGSGAFACTLQVVESESGTAVQGVLLRTMNVGESMTAATGVSNGDGTALFSLDAAEYHVYPYLTGYLFSELPETVNVTTSGALDTLWCSRFDPGEPPAADLCRVYGFIHSLGAEGLTDVIVSASILTAPLMHDGVVISPYSVSTTTDSTGYWHLDVIPNTDLTPTGTTYDFTIYNESGTMLRKQVSVPDSTSFLFKWSQD